MITNIFSISGNYEEYDVADFHELIKTLEKKKKIFSLCYGDIVVYHYLKINKTNITLEKNYNIVYLPYDYTLIDEINSLDYRNVDRKSLNDLYDNISHLFKEKKLYDDEIFLFFLARNLSFDENANCFSLISDDLKKDSLFMTELIDIDVPYIRFISTELLDDIPYIVNIIKKDIYVLEYMPKYVNNVNYIKKIIKQYGKLLARLNDEISDYFDIVLDVVKDNGLVLYYASNELKDNYNIVTEAVKQNGLALENASDNLKDNYNIVTEAVKQNPESLKYASTRLKDIFQISNKEVM